MKDNIHISLGNIVSGLEVGIPLPIIGGGISDAPTDGSVYARRKEDWTALSKVATSGDYDHLANLPDLSVLADKVPVSSEDVPIKEILPNVLYVWGEVSELDITLALAESTGVLQEYMFEFRSGTTATSLTLPASVTFSSEVKIKSGKTYQVSIVNNLGVIGEF